MHIQLTVLSLISLVCTKEVWVFCYYIIKYLCHFDVKFPEVVSVEGLSWWFGLYVYYLIYPWTLETRFSVVNNTKRYRWYPYQIIHINKLGGSFWITQQFCIFCGPCSLIEVIFDCFQCTKSVLDIFKDKNMSEA